MYIHFRAVFSSTISKVDEWERLLKLLQIAKKQTMI